MKFHKVFLAGVLAFFVGSIVCFFFWIMVLAGIAGAMSETPAEVKNNSILRLDFDELITDSPSRNPMKNFDILSMQQTPSLSLYDALRTIEAAASDDRIEGIYLRFGGMGGATSSAITEELRTALAEFKQYGKFVVAYGNAYSQGDYYLATAADKIYLQPEGLVDWHGMASGSPFFKGMFDRLGIRAEIFRPTACKYKSAVEPYFLDRMSDANREQTREMVSSMWNVVQSAVAEARGIELGELNRLTDALASFIAEDAQKYGFVDDLVYEDEMNDVFAGCGVEADADGEYSFVSFGDYAAQVGPDLENLSADRVAIVYADGSIYDGSGTDDAIYGDDLAATLADVRKDDGIKSVVLRVNSPGGSALASDVVWREMELLKAVKPVIVSMGGYAASGGYYISCPADAILADRLTLTGSIGVFGMLFDGEKMFRDKLGVTVEMVGSNASADFGANLLGLTLRPISASERAMLLRNVDKVYGSFTGKVAAGRNLPVEKVLDIAGGRVWSGEDALNIGLIDAWGGLKDAIAVAVDKAGLEEFRVEEVHEELTGFAAFFAALNGQVRAAVGSSRLGITPSLYERLRKSLPCNGVMMYSPCKVEL